MKSYALVLILGCLCLLACQPSEPTTTSSVTIRLPADPDRMIPLLSRTSYAREVASHLFLPLLDFDPQSFELVPVLATSRPTVQVDTLGQSGYQFEIRPEATWDNGDPINAADYIFTLKCIFHPQVNAARFRAYLNFVKEVIIDPVNPKRFTVYTNKPYMLAETALGNISLLPAYHYDPEARLANVPLDSLLNPAAADRLLAQDSLVLGFAQNFQADSLSHLPRQIVGCGPYRLVSWETNQQLVLQKKAQWWGNNISTPSPLLQAHPTQLIYRILPDIQTAISLLNNQELDVLSNIESSAFLEMQNDSSLQASYRFSSPVRPTYAYLALRRQHPGLSTPATRRAIAHLFDLEEMTQTILGGLAKRTVGPFHPQKTYYHHDLPLIDFNLDKARALLQREGWEDRDQDGILDKLIDGKKTDLQLRLSISSKYQPGQKMALLFRDAARQVGIDVVIRSLEFNTLIEDYRRRDFDLLMLSWQLPPLPDDPRQIWHTESDTPNGSNRIGFGDAVSDALIDSIGSTLDPLKRRPLYLRFQEIVYADQPYVFLYTPLHRIAIHQKYATETYSLSPGYFPGTFKEK